ncbi:MAG: ATP-binding protein [Patescibacteria group bacterium]
MAIKRVRVIGGWDNEIETDGSWHNFLAGDIITDESPTSAWHNHRVLVEGFDGGGLYGRRDDLTACHYDSNPHGGKDLTLLELPGYKFKVGDKVVFIGSGNRPSGKRGKVIVINPEVKEKARFLVEFTEWLGRNCDGNWADCWQQPWFPAKYENSSHSRWWCHEEELEIFIAPKEVMAVSDNMPAWLKEMIIALKAEVAQLFILFGNVGDWQKTADGRYLYLGDYLNEIFKQRLVMTYSVSAGLQFGEPAEEREKEFRRLWKKVVQKSQSLVGQSTAAGQARQQMLEAMEKAPLEQLLGGRSPDTVFPILEKIIKDDGAGDDLSVEPLKKSLIINYAHNVAGAAQGTVLTAADKVNIETIERWAAEAKIKEAASVVILITSQWSDLAPALRASQAKIKAIRLPKPNEEERTVYWQRLLSDGVTIETGLDAAKLGRLTSGLSLTQISNLYRVAQTTDSAITLSVLKNRKQEILNQEFGGQLKVTVPDWGFDYFGGKDEVKRHLLEIRDNIFSGMTRRCPMGILACGPPGTGKTFLFSCWAYECGFNFVTITNPRSLWLGESERIMEEILAALDDLSPVIVVEDEADQSETPRDVPNGDSGVSNHLRQMKFMFCSEPKRRGRVIWVRISNRDDLIDAAYKRKGRTDDTIPFILPSEKELAEIFSVMFARYEIPTEITDFSPLARKVAAKTYCTGADVEWMVLEADKLAGRENEEKVLTRHLEETIDDWEMNLDPRDIDHQTILAIFGSSRRLRPANWRQIVADAQARLRTSSPPPTPFIVGSLTKS